MGHVEQPTKVSPSDPTLRASPVQDGIGSDTLGNKMLQKMGWKAGDGLGKDGQGIVAPVTANVHVAGTGLGAAPAMEADAIGSQRAAAARLTRMRFDQIPPAPPGSSS